LPGAYDVQKDTEEIKEVTWRRGKPIKPGKQNKKKSEKKKSGQHNKEFKGVQDPLETQVIIFNNIYFTQFCNFLVQLIGVYYKSKFIEW